MDSSKVASPAPGLIPNQQNDMNVHPQNPVPVNNSTGIPTGNSAGVASVGLSEVDQTDLIHIVKILQKYNFKVLDFNL